MPKSPTTAFFDDLPQPSELVFIDYQAWHLPMHLAAGFAQGAASLFLAGLDFWAHRLTEDRKTLQGLMACWDFEAAERLQRDWLETAVRHYGGVNETVSNVTQQATGRLAEDFNDVWMLPAVSPAKDEASPKK